MSAPPKLKVLVNERITELYGWTAEALAGPVPEDNYGQKWPVGTLQYFKEIWAYREGGVNGHDKLYHMVNMIKLDLPNFQFTNRGYINSNALRVLKACCEKMDLGVAGAASTGKTYPIGAYILQDWKSAPSTTLSFVCTTTKEASEDRIWGAIVKMWQGSVYKVGTYVPHKYVIAWGKFSESAQDRDFNSAIKFIAIEKGNDGKKAIDTLRGRKQLNVRLVYDELPEMELYVTNGAVNLEANTPDIPTGATGLQVIGIGNPNSPNDAHGQMCMPDHPLGYKSVSKETPEWKTRTGWCIFLNGEWSPNFESPVGEPVPFPRLTSRKTLERMLVRCHGNPNSLDYWRNAIGFWPTGSVIQTVLTEELIMEKGAHKKEEKWRSERKRICGFDTGFTSGGDKCVASIGEVGMNALGRQVCQFYKQIVYMPEAGVVFEDSIAKQVVDDMIREGVKPDCFGMDISGDGGKIMAAIIRYWVTKNPDAVNIAPISSMGKPTERTFSSVDPRKCDEVFDRRVSEYWMMVREAVLCEVVKNLPLVNENNENGLHPVAEQLCTRVYSIKGKKFSIESKDEYKERAQKGSPDEADAFVYMIEMARRHGLVLITPRDTQRAKEMERKRMEDTFTPDRSYQSDDWGERDDEAASLEWLIAA